MYKIFEKLCQNRGITPYRFCKETGITTATISNWKAGRYVPKQDKMQKIADFFMVSIEYLMTGKEPENPQSPKKEIDTIAAHFDGDAYTEEELEEIRQFAAFVKSRKK